MTKKIELTQEIVRELLDYDPETGLLFWRERDIKWFEGENHHRERIRNGWNTRLSGKEALSHINDDGYKTGNLLSKYAFSHRIIWLWNYGNPLPEEIDHKNKIKTDNTLDNLFASDRKHNLKNKSKYKSNSTGVTGVLFDKKSGLYAPNIQVNKKRIWFKRTSSLEEAIKIRKEAEKEYGFTND